MRAVSVLLSIVIRNATVSPDAKVISVSVYTLGAIDGQDCCLSIVKSVLASLHSIVAVPVATRSFPTNKVAVLVYSHCVIFPFACACICTAPVVSGGMLPIFRIKGFAYEGVVLLTID